MPFALRLANAGDATEIHQIYAPLVNQTAISFELEPPDVSELARRIEDCAPHHPWIVCTDGEAVAGYAYAGPFRSRAAYRWCAEVSLAVHPQWHRRNIGRALCEALCRFLTLQQFGIALAVIALPNDPSIRLHEESGFVAVGTIHRAGYKLGSWHDVGLWERQLNAVSAPSPLLQVGEVAASTAWMKARDTLAATIR